jgi:hypothetical protein
VTTQVEGREAVVADSQLLGGRVGGGREDGDAVVLCGEHLSAHHSSDPDHNGSLSLSTHLQHVQQRSLSGIIETEEKQLSVLVQQAERRQNIVDCDGRGKSVNADFPRIPVTSRGPRRWRRGVLGVSAS